LVSDRGRTLIKTNVLGGPRQDMRSLTQACAGSVCCCAFWHPHSNLPDGREAPYQKYIRSLVLLRWTFTSILAIFSLTMRINRYFWTSGWNSATPIS